MADGLCIQCGTRPVEVDGDEYCATWPRCKPAVEKYLPQLGKSSGEVWDAITPPRDNWNDTGIFTSAFRQSEVYQHFSLETDAADHLTIEVVRDAVQRLAAGIRRDRIISSPPRFRVWVGDQEVEGVTGFEMTLRNPDLVEPPERITPPDYIFATPIDRRGMEERLRDMSFVISSPEGVFDLRLIGDW